MNARATLLALQEGRQRQLPQTQRKGQAVTARLDRKQNNLHATRKLVRSHTLLRNQGVRPKLSAAGKLDN